ncbi:MAG: hypothetical protein LUC86_04985 [Prevotellaceae bacterium]|nr:hypothetical protein [Prevotellaceae bacterium]
MKRCKNGHVFADDSLRFCTRCGEPLVAIPEPEDSAPDAGGIEPKAGTKKTGCLKKLLVALAIAAVCLGCFLYYIMNAATYLRLETDSLVASKGGGTGTVAVDYDGYVWEVSHKPDWVAIKENDDQMEITVGPNETGEIREGSVTVKSGKLHETLTIRQNAVATSIRASESSVSFSKDGGSEVVTVETDGCEWQASYPKWLSVSKEDDELSVRSGPNEGSYRSGQITVHEDNVQWAILVTQGGKCPVCNGNGLLLCGSCAGAGGWYLGFSYMQCFSCGGSGKVACGSCGGTGYKE